VIRSAFTRVGVGVALCAGLVVAPLGGGAGAPTALAGPHSEVASAFDEGDKFDLFVSIDYLFDIRHSTIKREFSGFEGTGPDDPLPIVKDLVYSGSRHTIVPRFELGIFHDLALSLAMPIVVSDSRSLEFDQDLGNELNLLSFSELSWSNMAGSPGPGL